MIARDNRVKFHHKKRPIPCSTTESGEKRGRKMNFFFLPNLSQTKFALVPTFGPIMEDDTCIYDMMFSKFHGSLAL